MLDLKLKLLEWYDPIATEWKQGYFIGFTKNWNTVVEDVDGGVVVLPNGTAQLRDIGTEYKEKQ